MTDGEDNELSPQEETDRFFPRPPAITGVATDDASSDPSDPFIAAAYRILGLPGHCHRLIAEQHLTYPGDTVKTIMDEALSGFLAICSIALFDPMVVRPAVPMVDKTYSPESLMIALTKAQVEYGWRLHPELLEFEAETLRRLACFIVQSNKKQLEWDECFNSTAVAAVLLKTSAEAIGCLRRAYYELRDLASSGASLPDRDLVTFSVKFGLSADKTTALYGLAASNASRPE